MTSLSTIKVGDLVTPEILHEIQGTIQEVERWKSQYGDAVRRHAATLWQQGEEQARIEVLTAALTGHQEALTKLTMAHTDLMRNVQALNPTGAPPTASNEEPRELWLLRDAVNSQANEISRLQRERNDLCRQYSDLRAEIGGDTPAECLELIQDQHLATRALRSGYDGAKTRLEELEARLGVLSGERDEAVARNIDHSNRITELIQERDRWIRDCWDTLKAVGRALGMDPPDETLDALPPMWRGKMSDKVAALRRTCDELTERLHKIETEGLEAAQDIVAQRDRALSELVPLRETMDAIHKAAAEAGWPAGSVADFITGLRKKLDLATSDVSALMAQARANGWRTGTLEDFLLYWKNRAMELSAQLTTATKQLADIQFPCGQHAFGPHTSPEGCTTWMDGCHCTVETLVAFEQQRDEAIAEVKALKAGHVESERQLRATQDELGAVMSQRDDAVAERDRLRVESSNHAADAETVRRQRDSAIARAEKAETERDASNAMAATNRRMYELECKMSDAAIARADKSDAARDLEKRTHGDEVGSLLNQLNAAVRERDEARSLCMPDDLHPLVYEVATLVGYSMVDHSPEHVGPSACWQVIRAVIERFTWYARHESVRDIANERQRQITEKGWTPQHDDEHTVGQLASAAAAYALCGAGWDEESVVAQYWPWRPCGLKANGRRRCFVKAGALLAAEIDRLDRVTNQPAQETT